MGQFLVSKMVRVYQKNFAQKNQASIASRFRNPEKEVAELTVEVNEPTRAKRTYAHSYAKKSRANVSPRFRSCVEPSVDRFSLKSRIQTAISKKYRPAPLSVVCRSPKATPTQRRRVAPKMVLLARSNANVVDLRSNNATMSPKMPKFASGGLEL